MLFLLKLSNSRWQISLALFFQSQFLFYFYFSEKKPLFLDIQSKLGTKLDF